MATLTPRPRVIVDEVEYDALELRTEVEPYAQDEDRRYWNPPLRASVLTPDGWKHFEDCHVEKRDGDFYVRTNIGPAYACS